MIYLAFLIIFSNGTIVKDRIHVGSVDECFLRAMNLIDYLERNPKVKTLDLECQ